MATQPAQGTPAPQPPHQILGGFAEKLLMGVGLATEEMPLAGNLLQLIAEMFQTFESHRAAGQQ